MRNGMQVPAPRQLLPQRGLQWLPAGAQVVRQSKGRSFKYLCVSEFARYTLAADFSPQLKVKNELQKKKSYIAFGFYQASFNPK